MGIEVQAMKILGGEAINEEMVTETSKALKCKFMHIT